VQRLIVLQGLYRVTQIKFEFPKRFACKIRNRGVQRQIGAHVPFPSGALCVRPENGWPCARSFSIVGSGHLKTVGMKLAALWNKILSV